MSPRASFVFVAAAAVVVASVRGQCPIHDGTEEMFFNVNTGTCEKLFSGASVSPVTADGDELFHYGRFEVRVRPVVCEGAVMSFFLYRPNSTHPMAAWSELDIEIFGSSQTLSFSSSAARLFQTNMIWSDPNSTQRSLRQRIHDASDWGVEKWGEEFHTIAIEWTPDFVAFLFDHRTVRRETDPALLAHFREPLSLHLNLWPMNKHISRFWGGTFDNRMYCGGGAAVTGLVDYVEVWRLDQEKHAFVSLWRDDFEGVVDAHDGGHWVRGDFTFDVNRALFRPENVRAVNGTLHMTLDRINLTKNIEKSPPLPTSCHQPSTENSGPHLVSQPMTGIASAAMCQRECQTRWECAAFTYDGRRGECVLHREGGEPRQMGGPSIVSGPQHCVEWCFDELPTGYEPNPFHRLAHHTVLSQRQCQFMCSQAMACGAYVYHPEGVTDDIDETGEPVTFNCELKRFLFNKPVRGTDTSARSAVKRACGYPLARELPEEVSCYRRGELSGIGVGLVEPVKEASECQAACARTPQCHYTGYGEWGSCYMVGWNGTIRENKDADLLVGPRSCDESCYDRGFIYAANDPSAAVGESDGSDGPEGCDRACKRAEGCRYFTWTGPQCQLIKKGLQSPLHITAPPSSPPSPSKQSCTDLCDDNPDCDEATYQPPTCHLKSRKHPISLVDGYFNDHMMQHVSGPAPCPDRRSADEGRPGADGGQGVCGEGYVSVGVGVGGSSCYRVSYEMATWREAESICRQEGGHLAVVDTEARQASVMSLFCPDGSCRVPAGGLHDNAYWIGLYRDEQDHWQWMDQSNVTMTPPTAADEPGESCALIQPMSIEDGSPSGGWLTAPCHYQCVHEVIDAPKWQNLPYCTANGKAGKATRVVRRYICEKRRNETSTKLLSLPPPPPLVSPTVCPAPGCCLNGRTLHGTVLTHPRPSAPVGSLQECQSLCARRPGCFHVVHGWREGTCVMYGWDAQVAEQGGEHMVAAPRSCDMSCVEEGFIYHPPRGARHYHTATVNATGGAASCHLVCQQNKGCTGYTWSPPECQTRDAESDTVLHSFPAPDSRSCPPAASTHYQPPTCTLILTDAQPPLPLPPTRQLIHPTFNRKYVSGPAACPSRSAASAFKGQSDDADGGQCRDGYFGLRNGECYRVVWEQQGWEGAQAVCEQSGGHLATVRDEADLSSLLGFFCSGSSAASCHIPAPQGTHDAIYHIGLHIDLSAEPRTWRWIDNTTLTGDMVAMMRELARARGGGDNDGPLCAYIKPQEVSTGRPAPPTQHWGLHPCHGHCEETPSSDSHHASTTAALPPCVTPGHHIGRLVATKHPFICQQRQQQQQTTTYSLPEQPELSPAAVLSSDVACRRIAVDIAAPTIGSALVGVSLAACQNRCQQSPECFSVVYRVVNEEGMATECLMKGWGGAGGFREDLSAVWAPRSCDNTCANEGFTIDDTSHRPFLVLSTSNSSNTSSSEEGPWSSRRGCSDACGKDGKCAAFVWRSALCRLMASHGDQRSLLAEVGGAPTDELCEAACDEEPSCVAHELEPPSCSLFGGPRPPLVPLHPAYVRSIQSTYAGPDGCPLRSSRVLAAHHSSTQQQQCTEGYTDIGGSCYKLQFGRLSWEEASSQCEREGGQLAAFDTQDGLSPFDALFSGAPYHVPERGEQDGEYWVSLRKHQREGWGWVGGHTHGQHDGDPHVDEKGLNQGSCGIIERSAGGERLKALSCVSKRRFVCEQNNASVLLAGSQAGAATPDEHEHDDTYLVVRVLGKDYDQITADATQLDGFLTDLQHTLTESFDEALDAARASGRAVSRRAANVQMIGVMRGSVIALFRLLNVKYSDSLPVWESILANASSPIRSTTAFSVDPSLSFMLMPSPPPLPVSSDCDHHRTCAPSFSYWEAEDQEEAATKSGLGGGGPARGGVDGRPLEDPWATSLPLHIYVLIGFGAVMLLILLVTAGALLWVRRTTTASDALQGRGRTKSSALPMTRKSVRFETQDDKGQHTGDFDDSPPGERCCQGEGQQGDEAPEEAGK
ncbi:unnamed protein product [Vitrella brassicaformis CCMP3155]|uniref:GH16 domain-containing protein n=5 Tax=Vitrella brassicaformis TaxID=1169539 RepID=A0A0G4H5A7_VITBC|nr:unnamed protein product [Vitrella brassicaformis CCMP3155]|eukprot:CEM38970.1 unnamed protein product [Vitrella brassicaformis CCMP3155]